MLQSLKTGLLAAALAAVVAILAGCGGGGIPNSSLLLRNATTNAIISTAAVPGTVTLAAGAQLPLLVVRTFKDGNGNTLTSDVTAFAVFELSGAAGVASIDAYGNVSALGAGTAQLLVKFRADALDPYDTVRLTVMVQ
jgi:hypothetical protein